jgi:Uncharacterised nucleotidyltransferase
VHEQVRRSQDYFNWHPSHEQELLLQAALMPGGRARQAWEEWYRAGALDRLDAGSQRLLPLLYLHLRAARIDHPWVGQFRKQYLDTWAKNQILFVNISPVLRSLREAGIDTLLLKGASLTLLYYKDYGLRPMSDFDFLVPAERALEAIDLVRRMNWVPQLKSPDRSLSAYVSILHALHFENAAKSPLDLHWHVLTECVGSDADRDFWDGAAPVQLNGVPSFCLNAVDELFLTCIHGARWNFMPPIRWVADAILILNSGKELDWDRMRKQAEKRRLALPLREALHYLRDQFEAPIPADFLTDLDRVPVSNEEWKEYQARKKRPYALVPYLWAFYPRISRDTGRPPGLLGFIKYLQDFWELEHIWQVPISLGRRIVRTLLRLPLD